MPSLRDALEAALVEDPDDLATHRAYADYLQEQGDPRGEFIQVQLALEDPERTTAERRELERRERELLAAHEREWLGVLADELLGPVEDPWQQHVENLHWDEPVYNDIRFVRGWLDRIALRALFLESRGDLGQLLRTAPEARLLREMIVEHHQILTLIPSPFLSNVRVFQLGESVDEDEGALGSFPCETVPTFVAALPRLEKLLLFARGYEAAHLFALPNLTSLRVLQIYHLEERHPLEVLAANTALANLNRLLLHPHAANEPLINLAGVRAVLHSPHLRSLTHLQLRCSDLGDVGCTEIVTSGILKRLKVLDLRHGEITDAGARILADCPDLRRLERLDIDRNGLTQPGIDALRRVLGDKLRADDQQTAAELAQQHYLSEGDGE
jgi:uncharacterized protein (TIGR02996 family)